MSCDPVHLAFSGYDVASGQLGEKLSSKRSKSDYTPAASGESARRLHPRGAARPDRRPDPDAPPIGSDPLLWLVPGACAGLLFLAFFGLPRIPTILISCLGAAYLALFAVRMDQAASDPANTLGLLTLDWQPGFWAVWLGLVAPLVAALLKPRGSPRPLQVQSIRYDASPSRAAVRLDAVSLAPARVSEPVSYTYQAPGQALCPDCSERPAIFWCAVHRRSLCLHCIAAHDVPAECSYLPGWRGEAVDSRSPRATDTVYTYQAPGQKLCPACGERPAIFYCRIHERSWCLQCVASHDKPSDCVYIPCFRAGASGDARTPVKNGAPSKFKAGSVLGIS